MDWLKSNTRLAIGLAIIALLLLWLGPKACQNSLDEGLEQRVESNRGEAFGDSAADAVDTIGEAQDREQDSETLGGRNAEEIRGAAGADQPVAPEVDRAGRDALCRREAYKDWDFCKEPER